MTPPLQWKYHLVRIQISYTFSVSCYVFAGSKKFRQKVMDMKIPITYFKLQGLVSKRVARIKNGKEEGPPIQVWEEIVKYVQCNKKENDIL